MSKTGATERAAEEAPLHPTLVPPPRPSAAAQATSQASSAVDSFFIPDFCAPRMVFAVVLIAELVALTLSLARPDAAFLTELARVSMFLQWLGLTSAAVLCYSRPWLARLSVPQSSAAVFALLLANTTVISALALWFGTALTPGGFVESALPSEHVPFLLRNAGICVIVTALLLRYFFVTHQWQKHVRAEARRGSRHCRRGFAAFSLQQPEHDRGAHAQRSGASGGSRRGLGRSFSRHAARLA
jgi:hypothetical protein